MAEVREPASASSSEAGARGGTGFELRLERGAAAVRLVDREVAPGLALDALTLEIPDVQFPFDMSQGAAQFRHRLSALVELRVAATPALVEAALARLDLGGLGVSEPRVAFREGFAELAGRISAGPAFTLEAGLAPRGEQGLAVVFHSPRLYGPAPIPAAALPHLAARALAAALPGGLLGEPVAPLLRRVLAPRGWKLPRPGGAPLAQAEISGGALRLAWARAAAGPAALPAGAELLAAEEGARAFPAAEAALAGGMYAAAREALLAAGAAAATHPFVAERLLSLLLVEERFHDEALDLAAEWLGRRPDFAPALAAETLVHLARGQEARAAAGFTALARGAAARGAAFAAVAAAEAAFALPGAARPDALAAVELALGLRRDHVPALRALRALAAASGDREALLRADRRLVAYDPDEAQKARAHAELGELLLRSDPAAARLHLDQALRLAPEDPAALAALARACAAAGEPLRAVRALDRLRELHLARGDRAAAAAAALEAGESWDGPLGHPENALPCFRAAAELAPSAETHARAARAAEALGHWAEAADHRAELLARLDLAAPGAAALAVQARTALADVAERRLGDPAAAAAHLEAAATLAPDDAGLLRRLAGLQRGLGRAEALVATLDRLAPLTAAGAERAALLAEAGEALLGLGRPDPAAQRLRAALAEDPTSRAALEGSLRAAAARGDASAERDALAHALPLAGDPAEAAALQDRLADAALRAGDLDTARAAAAAARAALPTPERLEAELRLARRAGAPGPLAALLAEAIAAAPGAAGAPLRLELADLLEARGDVAAAARLAVEALDRDPASLAALRAVTAPARGASLAPARRADLLLRRAEHPEAGAGEAAAALVERARLLEAAGELPGALAALRAAAARAPETDEALELRAAVSARAGAPGEAATALLARARRAQERGEGGVGDRLAEAGLAALAAGLPGAAQALRDALPLSPERDLARAALTALADEARGRGDAAAEGEALAALAPLLPTGARPAALLRRSALALAAGDRPTARASAEEARALAPREPAAVEAARAAAEAEGDLSAVAERLEELAALLPDEAGPRWLDRARLLAALDRAAEADAAYEAALSALPPDRELADEHARLRRDALPERPASAPLEAYARRTPDAAEAARALRAASAVALARGDLGAALRAARRAYARTQDRPGFAGPLLARVLYLSGAAAEALVLHRRLLEAGLANLPPEDALTVARQLAELAEDQGERPLALAALREVRARRPQDLDAALRRFELDDDPERAVRELVAAAAASRSEVARARALGRAAEAALRELGDEPLAAELFRGALEAAAPSPALAAELARARAAALRAVLGDAAPGLAEALEEAAELAQDAGDASGARALLADAAALARALGRPGEAARQLLQLDALAAAEGDFAASAARAREAGALLLDANDLPGAADALRRALAGDPEDREAAALLERVARALGPAGAPLLSEALAALGEAGPGPAPAAPPAWGSLELELGELDLGELDLGEDALEPVAGPEVPFAGESPPFDGAPWEVELPSLEARAPEAAAPEDAPRSAPALGDGDGGAGPLAGPPSSGDGGTAWPSTPEAHAREAAAAALERGLAAEEPARRAAAFVAAADALAGVGAEPGEIRDLVALACEAAPDAAEPWRARARIEAALGDPLEAARALLALSLRTEGQEAAAAALEAARLFEEGGRHDEALRAGRAALHADPGCAAARALLERDAPPRAPDPAADPAVRAAELASRGRAHRGLGDLAASHACLGEALALDPSDLSVIGDLGQVAEALGRFDEAVRLGEVSADALAPYDPLAAAARYRELAGMLRERLSAPERAEVMLQKALAVVPDDVEARRELLSAWATRSETGPRALQGWLELARLEPTDAPALAAVAALAARLAGAPGAPRARLTEQGRLAASLAAFAEPGRPAPPPAPVAPRVPTEIRDRLVAPLAAGPVARLLALLAPWLEPLFPADLGRLGAGPADRLGPERAPALRAAFDAAARALGTRAHGLFLTAQPGHEIAVENTRPASVVMAAGIAALPASALPFVAARTLDLLHHGGALAAKFAPRDLAILLELACRFAGGAPPALGLPAERAGSFLAALEATVPAPVRASAEALGGAAAGELRTLDPRAFAAALRRTAGRVGLLHAGDPGAALRALALLDRRLEGGAAGAGQALALPDLRDLAVLALSDAFVDLRLAVLG